MKVSLNMYSYKECMEASLKYFDGNELAASVFVDKYALRDNDGNILEKTPDDMHKRIAKEFARIEKKKFREPLSFEEIYGYLAHFGQIIPQGSPCYGIGNKYQTISLSNCFLLEPPEDSYGGILHTDQQLVQISKRRGGIGICLDNLRPEGFVTNNSSRTSTGIISFANRYSNSIREVGQFGRRGACLMSLNVHHPQVLDFAHCKDDETKVTGANISICLTDEFLRAVEEDIDYELRWPVDSDTPKISKMVSAREVWMDIISCAHNRAEPGLIFWDMVRNECPADSYEDFRTRGFNPCIPSWSKLLTKNGICKLEDVNIGDYIWSEDGWVKVINKICNGIKKVYKYKTYAGNFYGTDNHRIFSNSIKIEVDKADSIDILTGPYEKKDNSNPHLIMDGLVIGDGGKHKASDNLVFLYIGHDDEDYFNSEISHLIGKKRNGLGEYAWEIETSIQYNELECTYNRVIPDRMFHLSKDDTFSLLRGIYSANGSICGNRVTLKSSSIDMIEGVQSLLSSVGILSYYTTNKPHMVKFENGDYECKQSYDLNISRDRSKFCESIGFIQKYKMNKLIDIIDNLGKPSKPYKTTYEIVDKEFVSEEEVWDITVDGFSNSFYCDGLNVANCGEICLSPLDSCRLMALNLFACVKYPFEEKSEYDFDKLYNNAYIAQRLMDDMVDLELEAIKKIIKKIESDPEPEYIKSCEIRTWKKIKEVCENGRRTGTGITVLGDTLAACGYQYGSEDGNEFAEKIERTIKLAAYRCSVDMAEEIGPFPAWDIKKEKDNPFLLRIKDEDPQLYEKMSMYGRRNIALLTIAPTGTISILAGLNVNGKWYHNATSGVEPLFKEWYTRRKKVNHSDKNVRVDFVDKTGDSWMEFPVYHSGLKAWMDLKDIEEINDSNKHLSPYHNSCANDIDWIQRVKLQGRMQKHICHCISSTINLPNDVSVEDVAKIYETSWKHGLKGVTVYRDGCRSGVIIDKPSKSDTISTEATERPKVLNCEIHHITARTQPYFVLVGLLDGKPYEVFAGRNGILDDKIKEGQIVKVGRPKCYRLEVDGETLLQPITSACDEEQEALTRMISVCLRHHTPLNFLVDQIEKVQGDMMAFSKAIARVLKKYIPDGTPVDNTCPKCESRNLERQEGCAVCKECGYSACS